MTTQNININQKNAEDNKNDVIIFFNKCKILCKDFDSLDGVIVARDTLISPILYDSVKNDIVKFKTILNSSIYTSIQKTAQTTQRWPLLNLVRQLLRRYNYDLLPKRVSDGYTKDGKKKYKRFFEIKKQTNDIQ